MSTFEIILPTILTVCAAIVVAIVVRYIRNSNCLEGKVKQKLEDCIEDIVDRVLPGSKKIADALEGKQQEEKKEEEKAEKKEEVVTTNTPRMVVRMQPIQLEHQKSDTIVDSVMDSQASPTQIRD